MYAAVAAAAGRSGAGVAWDLYCGLGLIALYLSQHVPRVYAIESDPAQLELAKQHAALNGRQGIEFRSGAVEDVLADKRVWLGEAKPDLVVVDPPRAGLHPQAIAAILAARPRMIVYCSCNPQSLIRDAALLLASYPRYRLSQLRAFDMFPHTPHLETVAVFER